MDQPLKPQKQSHWRSIPVYVMYVVIALLLLLVWVFELAPQFKKISNHFIYSADILSVDDFYDEAARKFQGEHISKTMFGYDVVASNPAYLTINNFFRVRTINDKPIFAVERHYYIDPYSGRHVAVQGKEVRSGYLFAPHYATKQPYTYWHVNYDAPAKMEFVNTQNIDGLMVYHYQAHYVADQSANLTNLPGVPAKRGIKTDVWLQLWIEPVSGFLVKYQDNTLASYYDRKTGAIISPWNHFSNRYTQNSINAKVEEARRLKWKFLFIDFGVPLCIILLTAIIVFYSTVKKACAIVWLPIATAYRQRRRSVLISVAYFMLIGASVGSVYYVFGYEKEHALFTIGISQWNTNKELLSAIQGFKDGLAEYGFQDGKNVKLIIKNPNSSIENQINIIQSFVRDKVDIIFTLTTPGTLVAKGITTKIPIVFTDVSYPVESGIMNPDLSEQTNLVGTLNYISPAEQFFRFDVVFPYTKILGFVHHKGDPDSEIQFQEYKSTLSKQNIDVIDIPAIDFDDITNQLPLQLQAHHYNALFVACDTLMRDGGGRLAAEFSRAYKIPSFTCDEDSVIHGVMIGYYAKLYVIGKLAGIKAALILRGAEPSWLHTEAPARGFLLVNVSTAALLGIKIPMDELQRADTQ